MLASKKLALDLLKTMGVKSFPVDPITLSHKLGVKVVESAFPDNISGALIKERGSDPIIAINGKDSNNEKRFSCAHELGHYIYRTETMAGDKDVDKYEYVDLRGEEASNGTNPDEIFANQFAANLLMPKKEVKKVYKKFKTLPHNMVARHFGVSASALKHRLTNL